jgi:phenylacetate-CoA ligase
MMLGLRASPGCLSRQKVLDFQSHALRRVVAHAYHNVPYYRRLFDQSGIALRDVKTAADLESLPITTKKDLQGVPVQDTIARGLHPARLVEVTTSGASGEPLTIRRTWIEHRLFLRLALRALRYFGLRMTDRRVSVVYMVHGRKRRGALHKRALNACGIYRHAYVDCCQQPDRVLAALREWRPHVLEGYAGTLSHLAEFSMREGGDGIRPRFITSGAEVLTTNMRERISRAFGSPVYERYGSHELNLIAWECRETGELHVCDDSVVIEVLKDGRPAQPGEAGEVVGTSLHSFTMPFIRYRLGDIATRGGDTCACGLPFSTMRPLRRAREG